MSRGYSIYALVDPRDNKVFYIGKTIRDPLKRLAEHLEDSGMSPKQQRIREISESWEGLPDIVVLEDGITSEKRSFTREVFWIELLTTSGTVLTNASIDYRGEYFLADYPLAALSDEPPDGPIDDEDHGEQEEEVFSVGLDLSPYEDPPAAEAPPDEPLEERIDGDVEEQEEAPSLDLELPSYDELPPHPAPLYADFFRIEDCSTWTPLVEQARWSSARIQEARTANRANGRLLNCGMPTTREEIQEVVKRFRDGVSLIALETYFQRSRLSMQNILKKEAETGSQVSR